jgi:hypothetical protein
VSSRTARATQRNPVSEKPKKKKNGVGNLAMWLRVLVILAEDWSLILAPK